MKKLSPLILKFISIKHYSTHIFEGANDILLWLDKTTFASVILLFVARS